MGADPRWVEVPGSGESGVDGCRVVGLSELCPFDPSGSQGDVIGPYVQGEVPGEGSS